MYTAVFYLAPRKSNFSSFLVQYKPNIIPYICEYYPRNARGYLTSYFLFFIVTDEQNSNLFHCSACMGLVYGGLHASINRF